MLRGNTNKRVVALGHSFGNLHIHRALTFMSAAEKESVDEWLAVGAPLMGCTKALRILIGGEPHYFKHILGLKAGLNWNTQLAVSTFSGSLFDLLPKHNTFQATDSELAFIEDTIRLNEPTLLLDSGLNGFLTSPVLKVKERAYFSTPEDYLSVIHQIG